MIRIRRTFSFDRNEKTWPLSPRMSGKTLVLLSASGEFDFRPGGLRQHWDHLEPHVRTCARYLGADPESLHQSPSNTREY